MKRMKVAWVLSAVLAIASAPALANPHGHVRFGVFIGGPIYPWWGPPYYYYYPPYYPYPSAAVTVPAAPTTYIEKGETQAPAPGYWYYCAGSKTYYPYVKECAGGWQRVTPQPGPGK